MQSTSISRTDQLPVCDYREQWIAALCITVPMILIYVDDVMDSKCDNRPRADRLRKGFRI